MNSVTSGAGGPLALQRHSRPIACTSSGFRKSRDLVGRIVLLLLMATAAQSAGTAPAAGGTVRQVDAKEKRPLQGSLRGAMGKARFVDWDGDQSRFRLVSGGLTAEIGPDAMTICARGDRAADVIRMEMVGAACRGKLWGEQQLPERINYLLGSKPEQWRRRLRCYSRLRSRNLYDGIDLLYHSRQGELEHDFELAPGADPEQIRFRFTCGSGESLPVEAAPDGSLILGREPAALRQKAPVAYQDINGTRRAVAVRFAPRGGAWGFTLGAYDRTHPLVIDPIWAYCTRMGVTPDDYVHSVLMDAYGAGGIIVFGSTSSPAMPLIDPIDSEIETEPGPGSESISDGFIARLGAEGSLKSLTYLGGSA